MKLILFAAVVMFQCSRLSSAPADSTTDINLKNSANEFSLNQPDYVVANHPGELSYVSNDEGAGTTGVVFQFRRSIKSDNTEIEARRRSALDKGFMRFGRAGSNIMRFGRSPAEDEPEDDSVPLRMRKADKNIMRFGRGGNMMRFGRSFGGNFDNEDYENDANEIDDYENHLMRNPEGREVHIVRHNPEGKGIQIIRLGRSSSESENDEDAADSPPIPDKSEERNGVKKNDKNIIRFGRAGNMMRFGRGNMMRFGKRGNMMRFGRSGNEPPRKLFKAPYFPSRVIRGSSNDRNLLRLGRGGNLIRFGRNEKNLMRFGKRSGPEASSSSARIYCEDDDCIVQENENQLTQNDENEAEKSDQLQELFGENSLSKQQGYGEYVNEK